MKRDFFKNLQVAIDSRKNLLLNLELNLIYKLEDNFIINVSEISTLVDEIKYLEDLYDRANRGVV